MTRAPITTVLAGLLAAAIAGCGITNPYQPPPGKAAAVTSSSTSTSTMSAADSGDPAPERNGTIPPGTQAAQDRLAAGAGATSPQAALERYASLYVNWSASTLAARQRELASISLGQARAQALQAAASTARDPELTHSQVSDQGQLVAIAPGSGAAASQWVLVTRERTTGQGDYQGLPATLHVIYAQLTHTHAGWIVSKWNPQT